MLSSLKYEYLLMWNFSSEPRNKTMRCSNFLSSFKTKIISKELFIYVGIFRDVFSLVVSYGGFSIYFLFVYYTTVHTL